MIDERHPDVGLFYSYHGKERVHLRIVPMETTDFPYGLALDYRFEDGDREAKAHEMAIKVQKYINDMRELT